MTETWPERLSEHWSFQEAIHSSRAEELGLENQPPLELLPNALRIASLAEDLRAGLALHYGREIPLQTTSGYRCLRLNAVVGGSGAHPGEKMSAHTRFLAFDLIPYGIELEETFQVARTLGLAFDKLILETDGHATWLHLQASAPRAAPRRLVFRGHKGLSGSTFQPVTA